MRLITAAKCALWAVQGLVAAQILFFPLAHGAQDQPRVLDEIQRHRDNGDFGSAMVAAAGLQPPGLRAHYEAEILYSARSYDAALHMALEAIHSGDRDEFLLLTSVRAAIWVLDSDSASFCQQLLLDRVLAMEAGDLANHEWYRDESTKTGQMVEDLIAGDHDTEGAIHRSKSLSLAALGAALIGLYLARAKSR